MDTGDRTIGAGAETSDGPIGGRLYEQLRDDVLAGEFGPASLLHETTLTARYQVSRTPIREALARLEQDGLLERAARGYRVRAGTPGDVLEIYEARIALEGLVAARAARGCSDLELARLEFLAQAAATADNPDDERRLNAQWHRDLWTAAGNATVTNLLVRLTTQLRIYDGRRVEDQDDLTQSRAEHAELLDALRTRDPERARAASDRHLERSRALRLRDYAAAIPTH
ncbi:MAG TPA: GntR family transcriptional regulator [Cellulomonas sp.]